MRNFLLASAVLLALGARPAKADMVFYELLSSNLGSGFTGPFMEVEVNLTDSTHATITFTSLTNGGFTYLMHTNGAAAVNVNATSWTVSNIMASNTLPGGFTAPTPSDGGGPHNEDGFGSFNQIISLFDGFMTSASTISFVLTDTGGTWSSATNVTQSANPFAAQIGAYGGNFGVGFVNTGFAGMASPPSPTPPPFGGATPAPPSVILLATGVLGMFVRLRRRGLRAA
jgi:hypothetical protein